MKYNTVFENKNWVCYEPIDFEAGKKLADGARWCTEYRDRYLQIYRKWGTVYYCMHKRDKSIAIGLHFVAGEVREHVNKLCYSQKLATHKPVLPLYILEKLRKHHIKNFKKNQDGAKKEL